MSFAGLEAPNEDSQARFGVESTVAIINEPLSQSIKKSWAKPQMRLPDAAPFPMPRGGARKKA